ncbi:MAG: transcription termination factor Rho [Lachnospiraceae bacterium]|nr:transcription termination factor Rho [Lachnospiraceae bacterium]
MSKSNDLTLSELREIAKSHGIKGISTMRKPELMALLYSVSKKEKEEREAAERAAAEGAETAEDVAPVSDADEADEADADAAATASKDGAEEPIKKRRFISSIEAKSQAREAEAARRASLRTGRVGRTASEILRGPDARDGQTTDRMSRPPRRPYTPQLNLSTSSLSMSNTPGQPSFGQPTQTPQQPRPFQSKSFTAAHQVQGYGKMAVPPERLEGNEPTAQPFYERSLYNSDSERDDEDIPPYRREEEEYIQAPRVSSGYGRVRTPEVTKEEAATPEAEALTNGISAGGILELLPEGYGFIRSNHYLNGDNDIYVAPSQIRRFNLHTGDYIEGMRRNQSQGEKFPALLTVNSINGIAAEEYKAPTPFDNLTPIFPNERLKLEMPGCDISMRIMDIICPIGKGQRGMIVAPPKAGKTTLIKHIAQSILTNHPEVHLMVLLIDERPEEVTDIRESIGAHDSCEVIDSTFDQAPEHHKRVSEMVTERAKRLVENGKDVIILLDSITRLSRAYNLTVAPSGRTLSGGLDPAALYTPKRFFGAARNMREGGSLTILATALVDTGSRMDDVIFEEFKGTGNMEIVLDRHMSERRIFPAIDIARSGTRNEQLLLTPDELTAITKVRRVLSDQKADEATESILNLFEQTKTNEDFVARVNHSLR